MKHNGDLQIARHWEMRTPGLTSDHIGRIRGFGDVRHTSPRSLHLNHFRYMPVRRSTIFCLIDDAGVPLVADPVPLGEAARLLSEERNHLISSQIAGLSRISMFNSHQILEGVACVVPRRPPESRL
jgi:hypothetical protein